MRLFSSYVKVAGGIMKSKFVSLTYFIFASLFVMSGCKQATQASDQSRPLFAIDLQDGFQHDTVRVSLDNQVVYDDTATTSLALSLAYRMTPSISAGTHRINVWVPSFSVQADTTVDIQDTLVLGINLNRRMGTLSFTIYRFLLMYR